MDAVTDSPEQNAADMRQDIDSTRSAMAEKLVALEDKVMDTVQSAKDTVKDSVQSAKETVASVKRTFDLKHQIEQRPWTMVGGCFLAGLAVGHLLPASRSASSGPSSAPPRNGAYAPGPAPQMQAESASRLSLLEPFHEEIAKVKGIAIGYVMGLVRDSIKQSAPKMGSKFDELMDGITRKLGG